jgi:hypothetical protein
MNRTSASTKSAPGGITIAESAPDAEVWDEWSSPSCLFAHAPTTKAAHKAAKYLKITLVFRVE